MIKFEVCGINNHTVVPLLLDADNNIITTSGNSNNNGYKSSSNYIGLFLGQYNDELIPILVDDNGRIIV